MVGGRLKDARSMSTLRNFVMFRNGCLSSGILRDGTRYGSARATRCATSPFMISGADCRYSRTHMFLSHLGVHMKKLFSILCLVVFTATTTVEAKDTRTCTKTSTQEIAAIFDRWNA